jgi:TatD DNase family protein
MWNLSVKLTVKNEDSHLTVIRERIGALNISMHNILKDCRHLNLKGVFHAYSGSAETFRELQKLGDWYVGIGGVLTYKKASIAETVKEIPLERIILETDSPYLTPVPHRGKRNESSYIPHIAEKLATQKGITMEEVALTTTANATRLFRL